MRKKYTQPRTTVVILKYKPDSFQIEEGYACRRSILGFGPNQRWAGVKLNKTLCNASFGTCAVNFNEINSIPKDCIKVSSQEAQDILNEKVKFSDIKQMRKFEVAAINRERKQKGRRFEVGGIWLYGGNKEE
jgi:hypothetical protein